MRSIPAITKNLLIINLLMFIATFVFGRVGTDLNDLLGLHFFLAPDFHAYQLFTYMFMHGGLEHIFFNMFALWMFGCVVERTWGPKKFLVYYLVCGVGAGLMQEAAQYAYYRFEDLSQFDFVTVNGVRMATGAYLNMLTTVGASGAIYGILLAFGMIYPEERIFIFPLPVPIKAKWFVLIYAAVELFFALNQRGDGVAHVAHLGGMLFGYMLIRYWNRHPGSDYFGRQRGEQFFDSLRHSWEQRSRRKVGDDVHRSARVSQDKHTSDWDYNARKHAEQSEIDAILDKIRRSGYDSLTEAEKRKLFDSSKD